MNNRIKLFFIITIVISIILLTGCNNKENSNKITIISSSFPGYDFARAITKDSKNIETKMLLKAGSEMHDFEPTPQDIKNIKNSRIFIYVGGESDAWIEDILNDINTEDTKIIKLMDLVNPVEEEIVEGMEEQEREEKEYDEHVWTSPINAIEIIEKVKKEIIKVDPDNKNLYEDNANKYIQELRQVDEEIKDIVNNSKRKELVFGDRFPLRYFVDEYGLSYYAAFPGCSHQTEASAKTISFLINKVKEDNIPVIFHIELSDGKIANAISEATGAKVLEFKTAHNISQSNFDAGITYVDIMKDNISVLKEALN